MALQSKYDLSARRIVVPEGVTSNDYIFNPKGKDVLIESNHNGEVIVIGKEQGLLGDMSYDEAKMGIRTKYAGRTIFPVVECFETMVTHFGRVVVGEHWLVAAYGTGGRVKQYFLGDNMLKLQDSQPDAMKRALMATINSVDEEGRFLVLHVLLEKRGDEEFLRKHVEYGVEKIIVKGMDFWTGKGSSLVHQCVATHVEFVAEKYERVPKIVQKLKSIADVSVWRDLRTGQLIPSELEAFIILAALFFYHEGYAALNLIVVGSPGAGKSHQLDTFAYLIGNKSHNMPETTLKGLIYSHAKEGLPGILYRERFAAFLNEFMRMVGEARSKAQQHEDARRILTSLNDAVEKKRDRSRSSGLGQAEGTVACSILTSDNDYPSVVGPFMKAMIDDISYMRRYSYLKLSKETAKRGKMSARPPDWRKATDALLAANHLGKGKWYELMRYWRSVVPYALEQIPEETMCKIREYARGCLIENVRKVCSRGDLGDFEDVEKMGEGSATIGMLLEADFNQMALALLVSHVVMNSTFLCDEEAYPVLRVEQESVDVAKAALDRLIGDLFAELSPYVKERMSAEYGVQRVQF
jgi:hypothetical protein